MQATGEPGWRYIDLYPAIYKGKEIRPNNYRLPQLTFADDHPPARTCRASASRSRSRGKGRSGRAAASPAGHALKVRGR